MYIDIHQFTGGYLLKYAKNHFLAFGKKVIFVRVEMLLIFHVCVFEFFLFMLEHFFGFVYAMLNAVGFIIQTLL